MLSKFLEDSARRFPSKTALIMKIGYRTLSLTFKEVYDLSVQVACLLESKGVGKGDKVLLLAPNSPYWVCVFWGAILRGAIIVPLNIQSTRETVRKIADQTGATILFKYKYFKDSVPESLITYDIEFLREDVAGVDCSHFTKEKVGEDDLAQILYTSGTTGDPKGVMLTHKNLISNVTALSQAVPMSKKDRLLSILPLSHIFEQVAGFLAPFKNGSTIIYAHSISSVKDLLKEYKITKMAAVPEFLQVIMGRIEARAAEEGKEELLKKLMDVSEKMRWKVLQRLLFHQIHKGLGGSLDLVASGGAPLDPLLEKKWNALGITLLQGYGLTETSPIVTTNTLRHRRPGSVGKVLSGVKVKCASDGEILVKGPGVFQGYFKDEKKTKEAFSEDGWFRTGDTGEFDSEGFLYLKGRKKYIIIGPGGQNVYPEDLERELNKISTIQESCVVGRKMPSGHFEIHAVLLPSLETKEHFTKDVGDDALLEANKSLASYQHINTWSLWTEEDFPRSATRKVQKEKVLDWLQKKGSESDFSREDLRDKTPLMYIVADVTGVDIVRIVKSTKLVQKLNLDSLLRVELVARIEEKFGATILESDIIPTTTILDLEKIIEESKVSAREKYSKKPLPSSLFLLPRLLLQSIFIFFSTKTFMPVRIEGRENLKKVFSPVIFMPNHISFADSIALTAALPFSLRRRIAFAASHEVLYIRYKRFLPLIRTFFTMFPLEGRKGDNLKEGLEYIGRLIDVNYSVVIYPEGAMSRTGKLLPFKRGTGFVAVEMGLPIIPVKISGTSVVLPPGKLFPVERGEVTVTFGKPLIFSAKSSYDDVTKIIQRALQDL